MEVPAFAQVAFIVVLRDAQYEKDVLISIQWVDHGFGDFDYFERLLF
jgi:hypothetical protein